MIEAKFISDVTSCLLNSVLKPYYWWYKVILLLHAHTYIIGYGRMHFQLCTRTLHTDAVSTLR